MRRAISVAGMVVVAVLSFPGAAHANLWDWLQEFSGPGPFSTAPLKKVPYTTTIKCPEKIFSTQGRADIENFDPKKALSCFFFDHRAFQNTLPDKDPLGAGRVELHFFEFGATRQLHPAVELGFGGGFMTIASKGEVTTKGVLTLPRVLMTPSMIFPEPKSAEWRRFLRSFKYYVRLNIILKELSGDDFGVTDSKFQTKYERVASAGFMFDLTQLLQFFPPTK